MKSLGNLFKTADGKNYAFVFMLVCSLFLLWGFAHALLDVLNKHFQNSLQVTKAQSGCVQAAVYGGYFLMAIPAGLLARRFGYKGGILFGLTLFALGAFWFVPATHATEWTGVISWVGATFSVDVAKATQMTAFSAFLLGLFVIALGLTCLETIANPYTTVLGPPETGASRINLAQTCNALGWILGPLVGGLLIFSSGGHVNTSNAQVATPYVGLGIVVTLVLVMFAFSKIPDIHTPEHAKVEGTHVDKTSGERSLWSQPHFVFAVVAQFLYVAAQTGINSFFINYVVEINKWPEQKAALLLSFGGMGLFMAGRFSGSFLMRLMKPHLALATYAMINVAMMGLVVAGLGIVSAGALIACYFFMSVMFPTIFALGIRGLGENTKKGSSFIVMSIVGGAIAPMAMGKIADVSGMQVGFIIPLVCFAAIMVYGLTWKKLFARDMGADESAAPAMPPH